MLFMRLCQAFVLLFALLISWNSVASSQKLWKRQASKVCPNKKWKEHNGMCFLKIDYGSLPNEVDIICRDKFVGSNLAKIRSMDDLIFINNSFGFESSTYWIGLKREWRSDWTRDSVWRDGTKPTFLNFADQSLGSNEHCVSIHPDLKFYVGGCRRRNKSICTAPAAVDLCKTKSVRCHTNAKCYSTYFSFVCLCNDGFAGDGIASCSRSKGCPSAEWKEHKGLCYIHIPTSLAYEDARAACKQKHSGASLAKFRYDGDNDFLMSVYKNYGYHWIGLRWTESNNLRDGLRWDDNSTVTYIKYSETEPNNFGSNERCLEIQNSEEWFDYNCDYHNPPYCSVEIREERTPEKQ